jgi:hypothetical protein
MRRLPLLLLFAAIVLACATTLTPRETFPPLLVTNRAWNQVTVYAGPRRLGICESYRTCRLRVRTNDVTNGTMLIGYRELTWERARILWVGEAAWEFAPWELVVGAMPQFSYIRPAPATEGS